MHAVHELHIWRLNQKKTLASAHITVSDNDMDAFMTIANTINECLHAYGIHSATLQPEFSPEQALAANANMMPVEADVRGGVLRERSKSGTLCLVGCQSSQCEELSCCD